MEALSQYIPLDGLKIILTFLLSFLIGFEREERYSSDKSRFFFGGVRTFPLIGILGYVVARVSNGDTILIAAGFICVTGFMYFSYREKLATGLIAGITSEISALLTYFIGIIVYKEFYWMAVTLVVASALLLELKNVLEDLAKRIPEDEIFTFTKFLFLSAVILPVVPNEELSSFKINPFTTWLIVVTISSLSYAIYVLKKIWSARGGLVVTAILGGAYSSTVTSILLAKQSLLSDLPRLISGAILISSGMMYIRLLLLIGIFNINIVHKLGWIFFLLGTFGVLFGVAWLWQTKTKTTEGEATHSKNPLEIGSAIFFAVAFLSMTVLAHLVENHWGHIGIYGLSFLTGLMDVDPFVMSLVKGVELDTSVAAKAILIATISNNLMKSVYVYLIARGEAKYQGSAFLLGLALAGFGCFFFVG